MDINTDNPLVSDEHTVVRLEAAQSSKLTGLETGRGLAALLVVLCHAGSHTREVYGSFALAKLFIFGHAGVDFFFVLSGFIIFHVHCADICRPARLTRYAERRFTRIYPTYWLALGITRVSIIPSRHPFPPTKQILTSFLLRQRAASSSHGF